MTAAPHPRLSERNPVRRLLAAALLAAALTLTSAVAALADPSVGNSGHSNNGSTQCQAGGEDHCPPFGTDN
jgi:hypothetical protein